MISEHLAEGSESVGKPMSDSEEWNKSLISRKLVRMEYAPYPAENEVHCRKRTLHAIEIFLFFLALLIAFAGCLLWARFH